MQRRSLQDLKQNHYMLQESEWVLCQVEIAKARSRTPHRGWSGLLVRLTLKLLTFSQGMKCWFCKSHQLKGKDPKQGPERNMKTQWVKKSSEQVSWVRCVMENPTPSNPAAETTQAKKNKMQNWFRSATEETKHSQINTFLCWKKQNRKLLPPPGGKTVAFFFSSTMKKFQSLFFFFSNLVFIF